MEIKPRFMKRNVILMGGKTHVISLPSQWVKKYNVHKGEELEVLEQDNSIIISTENHTLGYESDINLSQSNHLIGRTIGALYKSGYDNIKVYYETKEQLVKIEETLNRTCIGFEITNQGHKYVRIKSVSQIVPEEFDNSLKRLFYTIEIMNLELQEAIESKNKSKLKNIILKDNQANKLADFCRRAINSGETKRLSKPGVVYYIIEQLERLGDLYKKIASLDLEATDKQNNLKNINDLFVSFRELYYNFSLENIEKFNEMFEKIRKDLESLEKTEFVIYQEFLAGQIFDMNGALLTLKV